jgi:hypothetical protein
MDTQVNLHSGNEMWSDTLIRQICEQAPIAFCWNGLSKAYTIDLDDSSPTIEFTIPMSHIRNNTWKVSRSTWFVNKMKVFSRYQQEKGRYIDERTGLTVYPLM